jgi:hypothetical protein
MNHDICRSCAAKIIWVKTANKKSMPIDAEPCEGGNIDISTGIAQVVNPKEVLAGTALYKSHFVTCPHSHLHRKKK